MPIVENINIPQQKTRILVAPLDWGLGHATRCIPIIKLLQQEGCDVVIAAEGLIATLLQEEFPTVTIVPLKGYRITYNKNGKGFVWQLLKQLPSIIKSIGYERKWLKSYLQKEKFDAIVSDNRYGFNHASLPSVFITHQLNIKTGYRMADRLVRIINNGYINRFTDCWVPDAAGDENLSGELSHGKISLSTPVTFIGPLSRFKRSNQLMRYKIALLVSGPEPQRSVFEQLLLKAVERVSVNVIMVRGLPGISSMPENVSGPITIVNHLPAKELNEVLLQSEYVITRSGYSTVMDMVTLQKKALLVPTPGQTEQEYLANYLAEKKIFCFQQQQNFTLSNAIEMLESFAFNNITAIDFNVNSIRNWVRMITKNKC